MYACAASFCSNTRYNVKQRNADITFHKFPTDNDVCRKWIQFCKQHKSWKSTKQSIVCSAHFKPEDYQLSKLPLHLKSIALRRLHPSAVPSVIYGHAEIIKQTDKSVQTNAREDMDASDKGHPTDPMLLRYRDKFCRTCLRYCKDESFISVDAQIQNMTVLEMLIQLTAFETENNDAFPTVICLECKHKLEQAFNIRQEFITQSEHLLQLVAEERILEYFKTVSFEHFENRTRNRAPQESIFIDMNQAYRLSKKGLFGNDNQTVDTFQESQDTLHEEDASEMSNLNDHSCYTKVKGQSGHANAETCGEDSTAGVEPVGTQNSTTDVQQSRASDNQMEEADSCENVQRSYEEQKVSKRKRKAGVQRVRRKKLSKTMNSKRDRLGATAPKCFPFTTCYVCDTKHNSLVERDFHMREHIPMLPYQCKECNTSISNDDSQPSANVAVDKLIVLKTTNQLNLHLRMHRMPHKCEKCYHRFSNTTKLKYHFLAMHAHGENGMTCEYCGKQYFDKVGFTKHVAHHRNEQTGQFKCTICDRSFGVKSSLQRHEASHKGEKKHKCMYCDKLFSTSYNRLTHQRTHTGERPYECPDCDRTFSQSTTLKVHREARHNLGTSDKIQVPKSRTRPPPLLSGNGGRCPYAGCDYTAQNYSAMYAHKRNKHKPMHKCEVCSKSFAFANQLKTHAMLHTGEKPYQCEICERSFRLVKDYRFHVETHNSQASYSCKICSKSFKLQRYLQAHVLTHTEDRKFSCKICGSSYKTKGELKKHHQHKHGVVKTEEIIIKIEDLCDDDPNCATFYLTDGEK